MNKQLKNIINSIKFEQQCEDLHTQDGLKNYISLSEELDQYYIEVSDNLKQYYKNKIMKNYFSDDCIENFSDFIYKMFNDHLIDNKEFLNLYINTLDKSSVYSAKTKGLSMILSQQCKSLNKFGHRFSYFNKFSKLLRAMLTVLSCANEIDAKKLISMHYSKNEIVLKKCFLQNKNF